MDKSVLSFHPYGGLAEIGHNMGLFQTPKVSFLIDCGILFPDDPILGIDYLIPDWSGLKKPDFIFFTHGHEDHIGAVSHLVQDFPDIHIYCTPLAEKMILRKLSDISHWAKIKVLRAGEKFQEGDLRFQLVEVNHSIPHTVGLFFENDKKDFQCFFASDFKIDIEADAQPKFSLPNLASLFSQSCKFRIGFVDSTNILDPGKTPSEASLYEGLKAEIQSAPSHVFVTLFASNLYRVKTLLKIAKELKLPVFMEGISIERTLEYGLQTQILQESELKVIRSRDSAKTQKKKSLIFASGCQGDFRSSLTRIVDGAHPRWKVRPSNTFIFSSKVIPGNENKVYRIYNRITEQGGEIVTDRDALIHASGHPSQEDLKLFYENIPLTHIIPIHGESLYLKKHKEFLEHHFDHLKVLNLINHDTLYLTSRGELKTENGHYTPPRMVQRSMGLIEKSIISERRKLAEGGVFTAVFDAKRQLRTIKMFGIYEGQLKTHWNFARTLKDWGNELKRRSGEDFEEEIRIRTRRKLRDILGHKPIVLIFAV